MRCLAVVNALSVHKIIQQQTMPDYVRSYSLLNYALQMSKIYAENKIKSKLSNMVQTNYETLVPLTRLSGTRTEAKNEMFSL